MLKYTYNKREGFCIMNHFKSSMKIHALCLGIKAIVFAIAIGTVGGLMQIFEVGAYMAYVAMFPGPVLLLFDILLALGLAKLTLGKPVTITLEGGRVTITPKGKPPEYFYLDENVFSFQKAPPSQNIIKVLAYKYEIKILGKDGYVQTIAPYAFAREEFLRMGIKISNMPENLLIEDTDETAYEGIMMNILFGETIFKLRPKAANILTDCQKCGRSTYWEQSKLWCWITVLFIPLFPVGAKHVEVCPACYNGGNVKARVDLGV